MLLELKVSHFAVIDSLQVYFLRPGLNVLTGETGAGKSILIKSLSLLLGGKATPDVIRMGHDTAVIEGAFDLTERPDIKKDLEDLSLGSGDDNLVVRRIISQTGKHRLYINGHLSTLNVLERIVPRLIEITGQHEHHSLIKPISQLNLLDDYANLVGLREKYLETFLKTKELKAEIETVTASFRDREQRLDFLKFQINEIEGFDPKAGEETDLESRHQRVRFASKLSTFAQKAEGLLYSQESSVSSQLGDLAKESEILAHLDPKLRDLNKTLREASILVEDAAFGFRDYLKNDESDEQELERLAERLSSFKKLQKKYGSTAEEILKFMSQARFEYDSLEKGDENLKSLREMLSQANENLKLMAAEMHENRKKASRKLSQGINTELLALNMKGTEFSIDVKRSDHLTQTGEDEVSFLIKSSPKDGPRPLSKVASGGELSRLMLAVKQVISESDKPMTYLFDEVDTGVSGPTAEKVGRKLKSIGTSHQVVCITHLPQVAAFADAHFLISKEVSQGLVKSEIKELKQQDRVNELARLVSGEKITKASLTHAREMLETSI